MSLITKQPRDKNSEPCQQILLGFRNERCQHNNCWTRTTLTGVSIKNPQYTNSKGYFKFFLYYICESWYEPFQKYASRSPGWFKNYKQWQLYRYVYWEQYEIINWILTNLSVVICSAMSSCTIVYFATCAIDSQLWGYILNILRNIIVIVLHGLKFLFSLQVLYRQFYGKSKTMEWCQIILSVIWILLISNAAG